MATRRTLNYATVDDVIEDVRRLRRGYARAGQWSLAQACWHLNATTGSIMRPGPHPEPTPEQVAGRARLQAILDGGQLPSGIPAPDPVAPPADTPESAVDDFVATLGRVKAFAGPFAPHRLFGRLTDDEARRLILLHAAHHLSHLVPTGP